MHILSNVSYVKELKFNLLSVSQICDKKHNVLFTDSECLILSPEFKIVDENLVLLRAPRKNDVYSLNLKSIIPSGGVTCLVAKASEDETFKHDHSCLACRKGKQHKASCKKLEEKTVREPLELLHMDLFGPVSVESLNRKKFASCKGFKVYNRVTRKVQDCLHVDFLEMISVLVHGSSSIWEQRLFQKPITFDAQNKDLMKESDDDLLRMEFFMEIPLIDENKNTVEEIDLFSNIWHKLINVVLLQHSRIHINHPQRRSIGTTASELKQENC
ncbi:hypothetical protein Tco_0598241 [Tanacetum coccineum]